MLIVVLSVVNFSHVQCNTVTGLLFYGDSVKNSEIKKTKSL